MQNKKLEPLLETLTPATVDGGEDESVWRTGSLRLLPGDVADMLGVLIRPSSITPSRGLCQGKSQLNHLPPVVHYLYVIILKLIQKYSLLIILLSVSDKGS